MKYLLIISIIVNLIFLLLLYWIVYLESSDDNKYIYQYITYNNLKSDLKSGDMLLFSNQHYTLIPRIIGHPTFSHIGMIVEQNNQLYSLEIVDNAWIYRKKKKMDGIIVIPLKDRIKNYCGSVYVASLINPLTEIQQQKLYNFHIPNCRFLKWKDLYKFFSIFDKRSNIKMCSQFIVNILEELDIISNEQPYHFWKYHQQLIDLCNDNIYTHPLLIISNDLLINKLSDNKKLSIN